MNLSQNLRCSGLGAVGSGQQRRALLSPEPRALSQPRFWDEFILVSLFRQETPRERSCKVEGPPGLPVSSRRVRSAALIIKRMAHPDCRWIPSRFEVLPRVVVRRWPQRQSRCGTSLRAIARRTASPARIGRLGALYAFRAQDTSPARISRRGASAFGLGRRS